MNEPVVKLGQSTFQDTFFVACAQETPFRRLRQLELEIRELEGSLFKAECNMKRAQIDKARKKSEMEKTEDELRKQELQIDIDEIDFSIKQTFAVFADATERLDNFKAMKADLLVNVPQEYWDIGFERAEQQYWEIRIAKQLAYSQAIGIPDKAALDQLMLMPPESQLNIIQSARNTVLSIQHQEKLALGHDTTATEPS